MAIAALGLMRRGSSSTGGGEGGRPPRPHPHVEYPTSRSASIASTSSAAWYDSGLNSSSGTSSPVGPASVLEDGGSGASVGGSFGYDVGHGHEDVAEGDPRFMARVSQLPLVSGGLEWYERSKASSRVVKVRVHIPLPVDALPGRTLILPPFLSLAAASTELDSLNHPCRPSPAH